MVPSVIFVYFCFLLGIAETLYKVGVITPYSSELGWCTGALYLAKNSTASLFDKENDFIIIEDSKLSGSQTAGKTVEYREKDIKVIVGVPLTQEAQSAAELQAYWRRPLVSWYAPDTLLMNKTTYPTLIRVFPPSHKIVKPFIQLLRIYNWKNIGAVIEEENEEFALWTLIRTELSHQKNSDIRLLHRVTCTSHAAIDENCLLDIKDKARVIFLIMSSTKLSKYMNEAEKLGMGPDSDFVFIHYFWLDGMTDPKELWYGPTDHTWGNLILINLKLPDYDSYRPFMDRVIDESRKVNMDAIGMNYCNQNSSPLAQVISGYMHDALIVAYLVIKKMQENNIPIDRLFNTTNNLDYGGTIVKYVGKTGELRFDGSGDRIAEFCVKHYQNSRWEDIAMVDSESDSAYRTVNRLIWSYGGQKIPLDTPECGFDGKICKGRNALIASLVSIFLFACTVVGCYVVYRHRRNEQEIYKRSWVVEAADIAYSNKKALAEASQSGNGQQSPRGKKPLARMATKFSNALGSTISFVHNPTSSENFRIGVYHSTVVVIKPLQRYLSTDRATLEDLKTLHQMKADHINSFVGATVDSEPIVLMAYCSKGSLKDVLADDDIKLDSIFILSFLYDIARGMQFLHSSSIGSNGNLKSTNCVVDSRWVVKITDLGVLFSPENHIIHGGSNNVSSSEYYGQLLWTAPELLRVPGMPSKGTQKGDIYSFAIILQEVICRSAAYHHNLEFNEVTQRDIIEMVKAGPRNGALYRPLVFQESQFTYQNCKNWPFNCAQLTTLMRDCWNEDPSSRPSFTIIKRKFKDISQGSLGRTTLVDHMVVMLEKYAYNLEDLVEERTQALEQEKQKTENLLNSMLPKQVANRLKLGLAVQPESFDAVSIFFSDIVGFTTIAAMSEPLEIVSMLNRLYTLFDEIIESYEVYKVETIGDAYMVCSGLPERIDYHAHEIACMSLDFLAAVKDMVIDHMPDTQLRLRIGLHCGPCVAGIVGITMPRYCLFGDTVNTASRMESTGEALKIHCSSAMNKELLSYDDGFVTQKRGAIDIKGKGRQVTYWLLRKEGGTRSQRDSVNKSSTDRKRGSFVNAVDDILSAETTTQGQRKVSDISSGYETGNAYVVLDLPDHTLNKTTTNDRRQSESIRSLAEVMIEKNSAFGSPAESFLMLESLGSDHNRLEADAHSSYPLSMQADVSNESEKPIRRKSTSVLYQESELDKLDIEDSRRNGCSSAGKIRGLRKARKPHRHTLTAIPSVSSIPPLPPIAISDTTRKLAFIDDPMINTDTNNPNITTEQQKEIFVKSIEVADHMADHDSQL